ncbi:MAG: hypothetical protein ACLS7Z_03430 [Christensenellales bacterium]
MRYALFVSFFRSWSPDRLSARKLLRQVNEDHPLDERPFGRFAGDAAGLFEKLVIADRASLYVDAVYGNWQQASGLQILLATVAFAFRFTAISAGTATSPSARRRCWARSDGEFPPAVFRRLVRDFWRGGTSACPHGSGLRLYPAGRQPAR